MKPERIIANFAELDAGLSVYLGRVDYARAHDPLTPHVHAGSMEFVYVVKGRQVYSVGGEEYAVGSGELFITQADEAHGTSAHPEDKSLFYYLIIDVPALASGLLGADGEEGDRLAAALAGIRRRVLKAAPDTRALLDGILRCRAGGPFWKTRLRNHISGFLLGVIDADREAAGHEARSGAAAEYIEQHLGDAITLVDVASAAGLSVPGFKAGFRRQTGIPPREYILRRKVDRACEMLASSDGSVTDIAFALGFSSSQYFATVFRRFMNQSPRDYRRHFGRGI